MRKFNMEIEIREESMGQEKDKVKIVILWISNMIERAVNKPDPQTGRPKAAANMEEQRKYSKVIDALNTHKKGIVELEDDIFDYMYRKFHQAELPLQRDVSKILSQISKNMDKAKSEK